MIPATSGVAATRTPPPGPAAAPARPTQLPATTLPAFEVNLSDEAKKLAAVKAVTSAPVAVAAVSDNATVDSVATSVYLAQQANAAIDTYRTASPVQDNDDSGAGSPSLGKLALASAVTDNAQVDELATTVYLSRQAIEAVDRYSDAYQAASEQQNSYIDETA